MIELDYKNNHFFFEETPTAPALVNEIFQDNYRIFERGIKFEPGDVVLDIGANEGLFSIMLAKLYPYLRIIAFEPVPRTFFQMIRNIGLNGVTNVEPMNAGAGKEIDLHAYMNVHKTYSGGSSLVDTFDPVNHERVNVALRPLDELIVPYGRIKLLKIDIEGGEYEALYNCHNLDKVENIVAEFHINDRLIKQGRDINELATWVGSRSRLIYYDRCRMAD